MFGLQSNYITPGAHYEGLHDNTNPVVDIIHNDNKVEDPAVYLKIQRKLTDVSSIEADYRKESTSDVLIARKNILVLFLLVRPTVQVPVLIDIKTLRLSYLHSIIQSPTFHIGASGGVQALSCKISAPYPVFGYDKADYVFVLPSLGVYGQYQFNKHLSYSFDAHYLPIPLKKITGVFADFDTKLTYKLNSLLSVGMGGYYGLKSLDITNSVYEANGSYKVAGGLAFLEMHL